MALLTSINDAGLSIEEKYVEQAVYGKPLRPPNQAVEEFVSKANGRIHPSFDANGFSVERGKLMISLPNSDHSSQGGRQEL